MRILVLGAGALGGLFGARLTEAGEDVTLLEANVARAKLLGEEGLFLSEADAGERQVRLKVATSVEGLAPVDLLFVAVKSYQTEDAVRGALPVVAPKTWILSTQNGIGNVDRIRRVAPEARILTGITFHSIQHTGPNRLRYRTGIKPIQIAPVDGVLSDEVHAVGEMFRRAGLKTEIVPSVDGAVWQKLVHNAVVNPVSALTGMTCSELLEDDDMQDFMRALCGEIAAVMRARGTPLEDEEDPYRPIVRSQKALGKNRPSMWQDLVRGFRTEIDAMNGGVVAEAERLGLSAPLNWALVQLVHSRERHQRRHQEKGAQLLQEVKASQAEIPVRPSEGGRHAGTPNGRLPLECAPRLKELVHAYFLDLARAAREPGRRVAWCSGSRASGRSRSCGRWATPPTSPRTTPRSSGRPGRPRSTCAWRSPTGSPPTPRASSRATSGRGSPARARSPPSTGSRRSRGRTCSSTTRTSAPTWRAGSSTTATASARRSSGCTRPACSTRWTRSSSTRP
jgi:2-dehydropantoate 2-reductase